MRLWTTPPLSTCILRATKRRSATRPRNTAAACARCRTGSCRTCRPPRSAKTTRTCRRGTPSPPHNPKEYLYAFLARITRHISLNRCRDRRRLKRSAYICELSAELEQCIPAPDDAQCRLDDLALSEAINGFLGALDEEKRNLFLRRYWYLDSISDLARRFAMSESKVKTTLFRCRAQLRAHLEKEGYTL